MKKQNGGVRGGQRPPDIVPGADFGLGADGVGGVGEPPHLQRANVVHFSFTEDPAVTAWATRTMHLSRKG